MKKIKFIFAILVAGLLGTGCNKMVYYDDPFVAFLVSDATSIDCTAVRDSEYRVHLTSGKPKQAIEVTFSVNPGNGLKEGTDYKVTTEGNTLRFLPGIYELPIRISWMSNQIDKSKDNSLTIRLETVSDPNVTLGMPGPAENMREIKISKY